MSKCKLNPTGDHVFNHHDSEPRRCIYCGQPEYPRESITQPPSPPPESFTDNLATLPEESTPETDAEQNYMGHIKHPLGWMLVRASLARKLERERNEAREERDDAKAREHRTALELDQLRKVADALAVSLLNCSPMENYPSQRWSEQSDKRHSALAAYNQLTKGQE